jgi:biotin carboxyl carrier protein
MVEPTVQFFVTVATVAGTFTPADIAEGDEVRAGSPVGFVENRQGQTPVLAVHTGSLAEWLVHPGDPVASGQPLARLHPLETAR